MKHFRWLGAILAICVGVVPAQAAEYDGPGVTADVYMGYQGTLHPMMRLYIGSRGARLEPFSPADDAPDLYIARLADGTHYEIFLDRRRAYRSRMEEDELATVSGKFCSDFETRNKTGAETVSGRKTEIWKCAGAADGPDQVVWWDPELKVEIRKSRAGLVVELRNIKVGQPDPGLFEIPAGVRVIR